MAGSIGFLFLGVRERLSSLLALLVNLLVGVRLLPLAGFLHNDPELLNPIIAVEPPGGRTPL